jgi:hypothetical protein
VGSVGYKRVQKGRFTLDLFFLFLLISLLPLLLLPLPSLLLLYLLLSTRRNGIPFNADLTGRSAGWWRVVPGCGGSCPHPISNYLESKILKNDGNCLMALVADE